MIFSINDLLVAVGAQQARVARKQNLFLPNAHHTSVMNLLFSLSASASKEIELLCKNYSVTQPQAHGQFRACVWQAFVCHLSGF